MNGVDCENLIAFVGEKFQATKELCREGSFNNIEQETENNPNKYMSLSKQTRNNLNEIPLDFDEEFDKEILADVEGVELIDGVDCGNLKISAGEELQPTKKFPSWRNNFNEISLELDEDYLASPPPDQKYITSLAARIPPICIRLHIQEQKVNFLM